MRSRSKVLLGIIIVVLAIGVLNIGSGITGLFIEDVISPEITVETIKILDRSAIIEFSTNEPTRTAFYIEDQTISYEKDDTFKVDLKSLTPGKQYSYQIAACDMQSNCETYSSGFTTLSSAPTRIRQEPTQSFLTGFAIAPLAAAQSSVNTIMLILVGLVVGFVLVSGAAARMEDNKLLPVSVRMNALLSKAESSIKKNKHHEVYPMYEKMRGMYDRLNGHEKGKHQARVMGVYSHLASHSRAKEASHLVDKYLEGSINKPELQRLRDLLEE
jgi:hypothetical protein